MGEKELRDTEHKVKRSLSLSRKVPKNLKKLYDIANVMRRDVLEMTSKAGSGHPTSCMSCAEIMAVLFFDEMRYDVNHSKNEDNDEFI